MGKDELTESELSGDSSSDEPETPPNTATEYEKQRQSRIAENRARMEALGLTKMASSLMVSADNRREKNRKSKRVVEEEDDEYRPNDEDGDAVNDDLSSSTEEFEDEVETVKGRTSRSRSMKVKNRKSRSSKKLSLQKPADIPDFMGEDEALMKAIALSLKDSREFSDLPHFVSPQHSNPSAASNEKEDNTKKKRRKPFTSRVQMSDDDVVIHFCQFDGEEVGKGSITLRDLQRMATAHDFSWTDKEFADMIRYFDSDGDGKLTLDDFRDIVRRCNMLLETGNP